VKPDEPAITGLVYIPHLEGLETDTSVTAFWRHIIADFADGVCDGIGFQDVHDAEQLSRVECFSDWQPKVTGRATCVVERDTPSSGRKSYEASFALFELNDEALERVQRPMFHFWAITNSNYPVDRLYFFARDRVIINAQPYEEVILLCNLTKDLVARIEAVEPRATKGLITSRNWVVTSTVEREPGSPASSSTD
jgi:hypothetical protein